MVKRCAWGTCNSDSRYLERLKRENGGTVNFISFANAKKHKERREAWIRACCRDDNFVCTKDSYICSLHFIGKFGPTEENPDPITASTSAEKVILFGDLLKMWYFTTLHKVYNVYLFYIICAIISQVAQLSIGRGSHRLTGWMQQKPENGLEKPMKTVLRKHWLPCPYHPRQGVLKKYAPPKHLYR